MADENQIENLYDVVIVGGGPAGLTAALYLARARYRVIVVEKEKFGGQITVTSEIVNYPGVKNTSGTELTETMRQQAESFGAEFLLAEATKLELTGDIKTVKTSRGELKCFGILLATGSHPRTVGFPGEKEFRGHGVAYCATCDGEFFTGLEVFVIGDGLAAAEESVFLTKYAKHVTVLVSADDFDCPEEIANECKNHEKITVLVNTKVEEVGGDAALRFIKYKNTKTGEVSEFRPDDGKSFGVFVFAGYSPETALIENFEQDSRGYVLTDANHKTNKDGVYAAGDMCVKNLRQVVTAVGDAALCATELAKYSALMQKKTGQKPKQPASKPQATASGAHGAGGASGADASSNATSGGVISAEMAAQLNAVFERMENKVLLRLHTNSTGTAAELKQYMTELSALTEKISCEEKNISDSETPFVQVCKADGSETGLAFHGVPGGHEFTSFVLGVYNASGKGQPIDEADASRAKAISKPVSIKIMISLSCTMCPDLVVAAQKIACLNENVKAEVYDINFFGDMKDRYNVMSVPCMAIDTGSGEEKVSFGKKNISEVLDLIGA